MGGPIATGGQLPTICSSRLAIFQIPQVADVLFLQANVLQCS